MNPFNHEEAEACLDLFSALFSMREVSEALISKAMTTPYDHLKHADETLYMGRYWLREYGKDNGPAARIHHIATEDLDRHLHDHPWDFCSVVLSGGYTEIRPRWAAPNFVGDREDVFEVRREIGSIAFRKATDRHRIISVEPNTYTLFITGPKVQGWGFYTETGKIPWREYESCHNGIQAAG